MYDLPLSAFTNFGGVSDLPTIFGQQPQLFNLSYGGQYLSVDGEGRIAPSGIRSADDYCRFWAVSSPGVGRLGARATGFFDSRFSQQVPLRLADLVFQQSLCSWMGLPMQACVRDELGALAAVAEEQRQKMDALVEDAESELQRGRQLPSEARLFLQLAKAPAQQEGRGKFYTFAEILGSRTPLTGLPRELDPRGLEVGGIPPRYYDSGLATAVYFLNPGEVLDSDKAIVIFLHGTSGLRSNGVSNIDAMNAVSAVKKDGKKRRVLAPISVELPFHHFGPRDYDLHQFESDLNMRWLGAVIEKYLGYGKPVILFGRSGGANLALEYISRNPDHKLSGVIAMSPTNASREWLDHYFSWRRKNADTVPFSQIGFEWEFGFKMNVGYMHGRPFDVPTLMLVGALDFGQFVPADALDWYRDVSERFGMELVIFPNGGHNLMVGNNPENIRTLEEARDNVHNFLKRRIGIEF